MSHGPATEWKEDHSATQKSKLGLFMFLGYTIVYAGFIIINVFNPSLMATDIGSLNLAIIYGFGLIIFALILATVYNHYCTRLEEKMNPDSDDVDNGGDTK